MVSQLSPAPVNSGVRCFLIASLEDEMNKLIIVSVIATVITANFVERKLRGAASNYR